ncbi:putative Polycomb protein suz12-A [Glarea lozoyensis 74030]|uniref:Putative Polycomb protein suz12-A n=1 Tax=Glarea lozoyensis (strain ATCC 74030 / MF5533) TaxID=1104152 RepID=H0ELN4_GLAL7|nr:putative Polycomb protein suz12-A [Glarea lozoyensis 74030]
MTITSRKAVKVPKTRKPLFHTITKKALRPGDDLSSSDEEKDEAWLEHKHRDIIYDFSDIGFEEKEYINRWNPFITQKQYSTRTYLPQAIAEFMEKHKTWLVEKDSRKAEFVKQCETFILRGDITEGHLDELLARLKVEKNRLATKMDIDIDDELPPKPRAAARIVPGVSITASALRNLAAK